MKQNIMQTKKCEICGEYKPVNEFSKSYPHRCKACVAERTRLSRKAEKTKPTIKARIKDTDEIVDVAICNKTNGKEVSTYRLPDGRIVSGDYLDFSIEKKIDWEARRFELVKTCLYGILSAPDAELTLKELADTCVGSADAIIAKMKGSNDEQTKE
jgi:hypothetical protein